MHRFFTDPNNIDTANNRIYITGSDVNHIRNVLRMREGEEVSVAEGDKEYRCEIDSFIDNKVVLTIRFIKESNVELPCEVVLYQALPKSDKMEFVITKSVELGVSRIVPVSTDRAVVKLDKGSCGRKIARWNAISEAAAKQSRRAYIPEVTNLMTMEEALSDCAGFDVKIIPYELEDSGSMDNTRRLMGSIRPGDRIGVFIGPEGGFTKEEITAARKAGCVPVTLGRRILRTETAGLVVLSWLMYNIEP